MALGQAAELAPELETALLTARPEEIKLEQQGFFEFLTHAVPRLQKAGITVLMPSRWSRAGKRRAGLRLQMLNRGTERLPGATSALGMEQLVAFKTEPMLDGKPVTAEELAALAESTVPYVMFRGEWIEVDTKEIRQVLRYMKKKKNNICLSPNGCIWQRMKGRIPHGRAFPSLAPNLMGCLLSCSMDRCFAA